MVSVARQLLLAACLVALMSLGALALSSIYAGNLLLWLLIGAACASVALGLVLRRAPASTVAPTSVVALAGYTLMAVRLTAGDGDVIAAAKEALLGQIPRLLTAMIPVEPAPDTVVLPIIAVWVAGLVGAELALRGGRVLASFAAPTLVYIGALVVVGPNASQVGWQPIAYVAVAALGLAVSAGALGGGPIGAHPEGTDPVEASARLGAGHGLGARRQSGPRGLLLASLAAVVLVGAGVALGPALAAQVTTQPTDPRKYVERPELDTIDNNPLIRMSGWALNPTQRLFDLDVPGAAHPKDAPDRIRLAVLNDYDGITWRVGATYRAAGRVLPPPPEPVTRPQPVTQKITVHELGGRLLPAIESARRVDGVRVAYDQSSGTLLQPDGMRPGTRYEVLSERSRIEVNQLPEAEVPAGARVARFLRMGQTAPPKELQDIADHIKAEASSPYARAYGLETFLAEHYTYTVDAPSGHAYPNLKFFLAAKREDGGQRGTSEQFAASYAVIARLMGLPTRVVVGFRNPPGAGSRPVLASSAFAWPEVYFEGVGWVARNPLPQNGTSARPPEEEFKPEPEPSKKPETNQPIPGNTEELAKPTPPAKAAAAATSDGVRHLMAAAGVAGASLLLLAVLATPALLRRRRRSRRMDRGSPSSRIAGAWLEVLDTLRLAGRRPAPHLPASDVAALARQPLPGYEAMPLPSIDELAALANLVAFAPAEASELDASAARAAALAYLGALRAQRSWWRQVLWSLSPRPLFWNSPRQAAGPRVGLLVGAGGPPPDGMGDAGRPSR